MWPVLHLEKRKEEASIKALMWDWRLREVQRASQGREKQRERARDEGDDMGRLTRPLQGIARRLLIRTRANEVQGHPIHTNALNCFLCAADIPVSPSRAKRHVLHDLTKNRFWT